MKKIFFSCLFFLIYVVCIAQPGKDGALTVSSVGQVLNHYIPVSTNINAGSNTITIANSSLFPLCPGDLIMIYQAQGAGMDITNTTSYGTITAYNSAGLYEFKYVQSVNGNTITTQTTFTNSYAVAGRVQLIKVPQYTTLTINTGASVVAKNWNDTTIAATAYRFGGLAVIHAATIVNNGTIDASGSGFRGGALFMNSGIVAGVTAIRSTLSTQGGEKGESVFGYQIDYDINGGRYCLGAPANGGGGGDGHNAGGGGGANGFNGNSWSGQGVMIVNANNLLAAWALSSGYAGNGNALTSSSGGGHGGYSYGDANANATIQGPGNSAWVGDTRREVGGIGGRSLTNINAETRIYFGGGGGAAHADNYATPAGTNGGGIVYLISTNGISGLGSVISNGKNVGNSTGCNCDGLSGAGAGGSIIIKTAAIPVSQIVNANGGNGGNQMFPVSPSNPNESEGPGGGGGGGFVAISAGAVVPQINGGLNGTSLSNAIANEMTSNGSTQGATGQTTTVSTNFISFITIPTPPSGGSIISTCQGAALNLTTTAGASSYFWSGPNSFTSTLQNPTIANANSSASGIYTVTQTFSSCQPFAAYTITVTIDAIPNPNIINNSLNNICSGGIINLNGNGGASYSWSGPNSFTSSLQNAIISPAIINNSGNYTLTAFSVNGCSASIVSPVITINPSPTVSVNGASVCIGQQINLNANSQGSTFLWNGPNGFSSVAQAINFNNAGFNLSGPYSLTVTSPQGCTNTAISNVTVSPLPTPTLSSNSPVCAGSTLNLSGSGGVSYLYAGPNGFSSTQQNPSITNVTNAASGVYTLTASNFGCSASVTLSVSIYGSGTGTLTVSDNGKCIPFCSTFSVNTNAASIVSASLIINGQSFSGTTVNYCITRAGNYTVSSVFKDADGCINSSTIGINAYPKPVADFIFTPSKPVENIDNVIFTNASSGINQTKWNWYFNNNNGYTDSTQNTSYLFPHAGSYPVAMVVTNGWGCSDTVVKTIIIGDEFSFYVPNAFTPDGDGLNDIFQPKGVGITKYDLTIFDRWGEILFSSTDFFKGWDGKFKGQPCKTDTYTWLIHASDPEGRSKEYVGHVTLYK